MGETDRGSAADAASLDKQKFPSSHM